MGNWRLLGHSNAQNTMKAMKRELEGSDFLSIWRFIELSIYACVEHTQLHRGVRSHKRESHGEEVCSPLEESSQLPVDESECSHNLE